MELAGRGGQTERWEADYYKSGSAKLVVQHLWKTCFLS